MLIRQVDPAEISALAELARKSYADAFGHSFTPIERHLRLERLSEEYFFAVQSVDTILVAVDRELSGFLQFGDTVIAPISLPGDQEIRRLYVRSDFQNRGIGQKLMDAALAHPRMREAENIYLDVWEKNDGAQRFYKRNGFDLIDAHRLLVESDTATDMDLIMVRRATPYRPRTGLNPIDATRS